MFPVEAPVADITVERIREVRFLVFDEICRIRTPKIANIAPVGFLACMSAAVDSYPYSLEMQEHFINHDHAYPSDSRCWSSSSRTRT